MTGIQKDVKVAVFYFSGTSLDIFGYKIDMFNVSFFVALFFLIILVLELWVHCYKVIVHYGFTAWENQASESSNVFPLINPFLANGPILYPLKTPEDQIFSGVFRGGIKWEHLPEMG